MGLSWGGDPRVTIDVGADDTCQKIVKLMSSYLHGKLADLFLLNQSLRSCLLVGLYV